MFNMTIKDNHKLEGKTFVSGVWMDKDQLDTHMKYIAEKVTKSYQRWAKVAEYNTKH